MTNAYLAGERTMLRGVRREDLKHFGDWWDNADVTFYMESGWRPATDQILEAFFETATNNHNAVVFMIEEQKTGQLIGTCGLYEIFWPGRRAELRILIGEPSMFDKGYGTEATLTTLAYGFERLNMEVIHLGVSASNVRAVRSYEKAGFIQEGVRRNYVYSRGKYHDAVMMSVLRQDYMASKTP